MKYLFRKIPVALALILWGAAQAFAFLPPTDTLHGVTLRIEGMEEQSTDKGLNVTKVPTDKPLEITVTLANSRKEAVSGNIKVWLNADWLVNGTDSVTQVLRAGPGAETSATFTAKAKPAVLGGALYPIHAEVVLTLEGGKVSLHPIAIFESVKPAAPAPAAPSGKNAAKKNNAKSPPAPGDPDWKQLEETAVKSAQAAVRAVAGVKRKGTVTAKGNVLVVGGTAFGTAIFPGPQGLIDGVFAFSTVSKNDDDLLFRGFVCEIDNVRVGVPNGLPVVKVVRASAPRSELTHHVALRDGTVIPVRATIRRDGTALSVAWDMPGVKRDKRGSPRFTRLGIGPSNRAVFRAYAGFGNVIEKPGAFALGSGGFELSTRHVGADYEESFSLVQACDVFPDRLTHAPDARRFALETHHDAKFLFIPSASGAFTAARAYSAINGFRAAPGVATLLGRQSLDQWSGDYAGTTQGLALAAQYGLTDSIFIKHAWQRWGYDYRLPEIYPPAASKNQWMNGSQHDTDLPAFRAIRKAAADAGILFCPHDNYIDFYPDASGFNYDHIVFDERGNPVKHWYNSSRRATSFRWLPHAFAPRLRENMKLMREGFAPDSLFIDVFTAVTPFDYYDRAGNFFPRTRTVKEWSAAFDTARALLKPRAPMISEAGLDALVGSLDGGESDHFPASRWNMKFGDAERVPWHDMATHGRFVLFAGGLANRYGALQWDYIQQPGHGYASDDYLSNTVLGGRNPMSNGPFSQDAVLTYWHIHDVCASLAKATFETHTFGANIHQQHTTFGNGGKVWVNRDKEYWKFNPEVRPIGEPVDKVVVLPEYGFYAVTPEARAGVVIFNGRRIAFAISNGALFVDARPGESSAPRELADFGMLATDGAFRLLHPARGAWRLIPVPGKGTFRAELRLASLGASGRKVKSVKKISGAGVSDAKADAAALTWKQVDSVLHLSGDGKVFGYQIVFE